MSTTFSRWLTAKPSETRVYDLVHNRGFVHVGSDHETAEFTVESIRRWWQQWSKALYAGKKALLITADGGGSNGVRNRLWKRKLQDLANEEYLTITVVHYPPATSKWNKIEHRLFSFISLNWRAKPLTSLDVVLELISHTTTNEGLTVTALSDSNTYPTGMKISDEELAALHLLRDAFHGEWNSTILPQCTPSSDELIEAGAPHSFSDGFRVEDPITSDSMLSGRSLDGASQRTRCVAT